MNDMTAITRHSGRVVAKDAGRTIAFPLHPISKLVSGADLECNVSLFEMTVQPKTAGAPPHKHAHEDEIYYIVSGEMTFLIGTEVLVAGAGATVILPRGEMHATWNASDAPVHTLTFVSQETQFEHFFDMVVERVKKEGAANPMEAAAIVGQTSAEIGVMIDLSVMPEEAKPFFGMA